VFGEQLGVINSNGKSDWVFFFMRNSVVGGQLLSRLRTTLRFDQMLDVEHQRHVPIQQFSRARNPQPARRGAQPAHQGFLFAIYGINDQRELIWPLLRAGRSLSAGKRSSPSRPGRLLRPRRAGDRATTGRDSIPSVDGSAGDHIRELRAIEGNDRQLAPSEFLNLIV
jgi:hypothetical protein